MTPTKGIKQVTKRKNNELCLIKEYNEKGKLLSIADNKVKRTELVYGERGNCIKDKHRNVFRYNDIDKAIYKKSKSHEEFIEDENELEFKEIRNIYDNDGNKIYCSLTVNGKLEQEQWRTFIDGPEINKFYNEKGLLGRCEIISLSDTTDSDLKDIRHIKINGYNIRIDFIAHHINESTQLNYKYDEKDRIESVTNDSGDILLLVKYSDDGYRLDIETMETKEIRKYNEKFDLVYHNIFNKEDVTSKYYDFEYEYYAE